MLPAFLIVISSITLLGYVVAGRVVGDRNAASSRVERPTEPWTESETVRPPDLVKELADAKASGRPVVVCTGFRPLYDAGHVPGAVFHGPASKPEGLEDLKKWAEGIPRSSSVVVYCGCCPFDHCPNIRPAFEALRSMGFKKLRVLVLSNSFAKDWAEQGYAYDRGK